MQIRVNDYDSPDTLRRVAELLLTLASDADAEQQPQPIETTYVGEVSVIEPTVIEPAQPDAPIGSIPPTPQETKPKRRPRKNVEAPAPAVAAAPAGAESPAAESAPVASTPSPEATHADVVAAATKVMEKVGNNTKGQAAVRDLLKPFGVNLLRELPAEKRGEFIAACEAAVK